MQPDSLLSSTVEVQPLLYLAGEFWLLEVSSGQGVICPLAPEQAPAWVSSDMSQLYRTPKI